MINKILLIVVLCLNSCSIFSQASAQSNEVIERAVNQLAQELMQKYSTKHKANIAILEFRTSSDNISRLNAIIQKEINQVLGTYNNFMIIEQYSVNHILEELAWSLSNASSFKTYSSINENLFKVTGTVADVFIYGVIEVGENDVFITGYIVPEGIATNSVKATVKLPIENISLNFLEVN